MINNWLVTGDTHSDFTRFRNYDEKVRTDPYTAVIILGDAGLNWSLDENDSHMKNMLTKRYKFRIYCVRGNHEARPQNVPGMHLIYDEDVGGDVYIQDKWPTIRYFKDWGIYTIDGYRVAVIGSAYSVDKWYRLQMGYRWFEDEQLTKDEMEECRAELKGKDFDFVLTHTCPTSWMPTDLFLSSIDQSKVDKSMEVFFESLRTDIGTWGVWLFGHYHDDRLVRPGVEMFYKDTEKLDDIWNRWDHYWSTGELDWWLNKDPLFYQESI